MTQLILLLKNYLSAKYEKNKEKIKIKSEFQFNYAYLQAP